MKAFAQNRTTIDFTAVFRSIEIVAICFDTASESASSSVTFSYREAVGQNGALGQKKIVALDRALAARGKLT